MPFIGFVDPPEYFLPTLEEDNLVYLAELDFYYKFRDLVVNFNKVEELVSYIDSIQTTDIGICSSKKYVPAAAWALPENNTIVFMPDAMVTNRLRAMSNFVALHELSHLNISTSDVAHDQAFRNKHLELVKKYISDEACEFLKERYEYRLRDIRGKHCPQSYATG